MIRPAERSDLDNVALVNVKSWRTVCQGRVSPTRIEAFTIGECLSNWRYRFGQLDIRGEKLLVADRSGVEGFVYFGPSKDLDIDATACGQIYLLYVQPDAFGTGAGKALMEQALASLGVDGLLHTSLWVLEMNQRARVFYSRQGFSPDGSVDVDNRTGTPRLRYQRWRC
jgi:GNAT superfamily N-acetyltransferase